MYWWPTAWGQNNLSIYEEKICGLYTLMESSLTFCLLKGRCPRLACRTLLASESVFMFVALIRWILFTFIKLQTWSFLESEHHSKVKYTSFPWVLLRRLLRSKEKIWEWPPLCPFSGEAVASLTSSFHWESVAILAKIVKIENKVSSTL